MYHLERMLSEMCGMDAFTLQPAAGAHGELTGLMIFKAYFKEVSDKLDDYMKPEVRKRIDNIIEKLNCESHCNHDFKQMNDQAFGEIDKCVKCGIIKW